MRSIVFALLMLFASSGWCGFESGNTLKQKSAEPAGFSVGMFDGYVSAIYDTMSDGTPLFGYKACFPAANLITGGQLTAIVSKYFSDHPQLLHHSGSSLVAAAFAEAFPCPK